MNTYNENLQSTISNTLNALAAQQAVLASAKTSAEYALYYAQSAEVTAVDKLADTTTNLDYSQNVNDQSIINKNQSLNLLASMKEANTDVVTSNANMATAAANLQIASNAITTLASDIGAALSVATASLYDTQTYKKIVEVNNFINEVANDSKAVSMHAMESSSKTSEITAAVALTQSTAADALISNVLAATQAELDKYMSLSISENAVVATSKQAERLAEGVRDDADTQVDAISYAYNKANQELNLALSVTVSSLDTIEVSFNALPNPLPTFYAVPASGIAIPDAQPQYFLALVDQSQSSGLSLDRAEQLFAQKNAIDGPYFYPITPAGDGKPQEVLLEKDVYGTVIVGGNSYVAYIYIELSKEYKRYIGNFADQLSAASLPFIPVALLPAAQNLGLLSPLKTDSKPSSVGYATLSFDVDPRQAPIYDNATVALARVGSALQALQATFKQVPADSKLRSPLASLISAANNLQSQAGKLIPAIANGLMYDDLLTCELTDAEKTKFTAAKALVDASIKSNAQLMTQSQQAIKMAESQVGEIGNPLVPIEAQAMNQASGVFEATTSCSSAADNLQQYRTGYAALEFRCIAVQVGDLAKLNLDGSKDYPQLPIYFNRGIAEQVPLSNLEQASRAIVRSTEPAADVTDNASAAASGSDAASVSAPDPVPAADQTSAGEVADNQSNDAATVVPATGTAGVTDSDGKPVVIPKCQYLIKFDDTSTDNFGNKIESDVNYQTFVLSIVPGNANYKSVMVAAALTLPLLTEA